MNRLMERTKMSKQNGLISGRRVRLVKTNLILYTFLLPVIAFYAVFHYAPIYGLIIAFKDFNPYVGILESPWAPNYGFYQFIKFTQSIYFWRLIRNTFLLSFYSLVFGFPLPILFALFLVELRNNKFRSLVQSASYIPHFMSVTLVCGMLVTFLATQTGVVNNMLEALGFEEIAFMQHPEYFRTIYVTSGVWQTVGWNSIIYYSSLRAIDPSLFEAAEIDGASRWRKMTAISLPSILPTIITLLLLGLGGLLTVGFEKVFLLYAPNTYETADVLSTYVYRSGIVNQEFSFSAAVGLFNSMVRLVLILIFNTLARRISGESLW